MNFLIIGLGSMGKRRIRNLKALKFNNITGFDISRSRCEEVGKEYGVKTAADIRSVDIKSIDAVIISTPPHRHNEWIDFAIKNKKPAFVEASVILKGLLELKRKADKAKVEIIPSSTLRFHPAIRIIRDTVRSGKYGNVVNFSYHLGQYLPDWHPWEKVGDSYTGKKETSGAREMVAFELTWLLEIMGFPRKITGFYGRTMDFGVNIDDTYAIALKFDKAFAALTVDTTARYATRSLIMNLEKAQILWRWDERLVKLYEANNKKWQIINLPKGRAAKGYNPNIIEDMYIDEMASFVNAVKKRGKFPNSLEKDIKILTLLNKVENKR
jgi:predicted dehydrogenase